MGKAFVFGDNIDTDAIVPGQYLNLTTPEELGGVCMEGIEAGFATKISQGDVFVAASNFGCGSSREHAPISMKAAGVACVIAKSFARIFYRNAINIGLPVLEAPEAAAAIKPGDIVEVTLRTGEIINATTDKIFTFAPFPAEIMEILAAGGLVDYVRAKKTQRKG